MRDGEIKDRETEDVETEGDETEDSDERKGPVLATGGPRVGW